MGYLLYHSKVNVPILYKTKYAISSSKYYTTPNAKAISDLNKYSYKKQYISIRNVKINYHHYFSPKRNIRVVPCFSLSGIWLTEAGFQIGDNLTIKVKKNCLIIQKDKKQINESKSSKH